MFQLTDAHSVTRFRVVDRVTAAGLPMVLAEVLPAVLLALLLGACQPQPVAVPAPADQPPGPEWPAFDYAKAAAAGRTVYRLDPQRSRIEVVARSDGPLARFGHDHAVVVAAPEGYLLLESGPGTPTPERADLRFDLRSLDVDPADARARHGLDSEMSEMDIQGTRRNLLEKVLDAEGSPWVILDLNRFQAEGERFSADVSITLQGQQYTQRQHFRLLVDAAGVTVEGSFVLRHSDLGLTPYTALGGSLRVADPLEVHFRLAGVKS